MDFAASRSAKQVPIHEIDHRRLRENRRATRREYGRSELQVLHEVELANSAEHADRLVDFREAPEGLLLSLRRRVTRRVVGYNGAQANQAIREKYW